MIEIIGYLASIFVAFSFLMVSIVRLRIISLIGAAFFLSYGLLVGAIPIVLTNSFIICVHIYFLIKIFRSKTEDVIYLPIGEKRKQTLLDFINVWKEDIYRYYPLFNLNRLDSVFEGDGKVYLALKKSKPVGFAFFSSLPAEENIKDSLEREVIMYIRENLYPEQTGYLQIDYVSPKYRGIGLVTKMMNELTGHLDKDIKYLTAINENRNKSSRRFLLSNGYTEIKKFSIYTLYSREIS